MYMYKWSLMRVGPTLWGSNSDYSTSSSHGDVTMYDVIIVTYEVDKYMYKWSIVTVGPTL